MSIYVGVLLFASYGGSCDGGCVGGAPGLDRPQPLGCGIVAAVLVASVLTQFADPIQPLLPTTLGGESAA
jgi:hypothetical protein